MPSIPIASPLSYVGVLFLIVGVFLIITGLDIVKVEKLTVTAGRRTLIAGIVLAVVGAVFLLPDFVKTLQGVDGSAITPMPRSTTAIPSPTPARPTEPNPLPSAAVMPTDASAATSLPPSSPTETPMPTRTPTDTPTPSSGSSIIDRIVDTDVGLDVAMTWPLLARDDFADATSLENWTSLIPNNVPTATSFDGRFNFEVPDGGGPVFAVFLNKQVRYTDRVVASISFDPERQIGCDYGIIFAVDPDEQRYYQFITQNDQKSYGVSYVDFRNFENKPVARYGNLPAEAPLRTLAVVATGTTYRLFVNEFQITEFMDERLQSGRVGIVGICESREPSRFALDDFEVRGN